MCINHPAPRSSTSAVGDVYYSLLQFDLSGAPAVAAVATLRLYDTGSQGGNPVSTYLDQVTSSWDEATTWAARPSYSPLGQLAAPVVGSYYDIDITDLYNQWQSGVAPNFGVQLRPTGNNNLWDVFGSSENTTAEWRPELIVGSAVPLPAALPLFASGLAGLGWLSRRKKRVGNSL